MVLVAQSFCYEDLVHSMGNVEFGDFEENKRQIL